MKVLIVGGGGREHALAWKAARSRQVSRVFVAPGNAGTAGEKKVENIPISPTDIKGLVDMAMEISVDLTIIGPEAPLVVGITDAFSAAGLKCFGPTASAAQLEGSKVFAKDFLARHHIPTADYRVFSEVEAASAYIRRRGAPLVVKADGLAAGKGVILAETHEEAEAAAGEMLTERKFGEAGGTIVVEDLLYGEEASFIVMVDGVHILPLATSQDHKARYDGDRGPNTGGMGAYSPAPVVTTEVYDRVMNEVIVPTVRGMAEEGRPYTGFLYAGLMIDDKGFPKVLEFNCRCGDPETQPIMMRLASDLVEMCDAALEGTLDRMKVAWDPRASVGVVMAAGGYPGSYRKGDTIHGLPDREADDVKVFHAGTALKEGRVVTAGGRVLCVTALGDTVGDAQSKAYEMVKRINWQGVVYRSDIGYRALLRESREG
jgi:phosphoribosylamine---glycine ligase